MTIDINDEQQLRNFYFNIRLPDASARSLKLMRDIQQIIRAIAKEKGFDLYKVPK